jgi:hypothetical protein
MNRNFEYTSNLQLKIKALEGKLDAFKSGSKYAIILKEQKKKYTSYERKINRLESEIIHSIADNNRVCKKWREANEDLYDEFQKKIVTYEKRINKLIDKNLESEIEILNLRDELQIEKTKHYETRIQLEEEHLKNSHLKAQINRDHENSSIPSSQVMNRKIIQNNREKTDKKPGGQLGHKGHGRKYLTPTNIVDLEAPAEIKDSDNFIETGKEIIKQVISVSINLDVNEYHAKEYINKITGSRFHAPFPEGVVNDVNYDASVKAFSFILNNQCNVSIRKVQNFLSELTHGELKISVGMINGLSKEFSLRTKSERQEIFSDLLLSPVMNTDFTNARVNGKQVQVNVCATPENALYTAKLKKGHEGVKGTPVETYHGILVHDHDRTFYNYGDEHQECIIHVLRYLKDAIENEINLTWHTDMRKFFQNIIHLRKNLKAGVNFTESEIINFITEYDRILAKAEIEYEYEPATKYYMNGFNLYKRLKKYKNEHLLFLSDLRVPADNNLSERLARNFKRKQKQVMSFRSMENLEYLCKFMSMLYLWCVKDENIYDRIIEIFNKTPVIE